MHRDDTKRFCSAFDRALSAEMESMREKLGPSEVDLADGERMAEQSTSDRASPNYRFTLTGRDDKLVPGAECSLRYEGGEQLVTLLRIDDREGRVELRSEREIPLDRPPHRLVLYPWFLYEKLRSVLADLAESDAFFPASGLRLFGKLPPRVGGASPGVEGSAPGIGHPGLNESQQRAVALSSESDVAFVWGPPGTGKTTTLAAIVCSLLASGKRILLASTTNAAVDQALAKLASQADAKPFFERDEIVRIGRTNAPTYDAALRDVVNRQLRDVAARRQRLSARATEVQAQLAACRELGARVAAAANPAQADLFSGRTADSAVTVRDLSRIFSRTRAAKLHQLPAADLARCIERRAQRLEALPNLMALRLTGLARDEAMRERTVVGRARVLLATLANIYFSPLLSAERFDAVIVDEAGMAVLPSLFYAACLAREKCIMVGDPRQLPSIVHSETRDAQLFLARSIFEVTVPEPEHSAIVAMLDLQYRMHPRIGALVSELYYGGRLRHSHETESRSSVAASAPYPGAALVVVDTRGRAPCATPPGSHSRFNERSAAFCVDLVRQALDAGIESIAVITPYAEQSRVIRRLLPARRERGQVDCSTVHRFQGHERDLVILDTVDAAPLRPGVLLSGRGTSDAAAKLLNVSLSRARGKLIIVGDVDYFHQRAPDGPLTVALAHALRTAERVSLA